MRQQYFFNDLFMENFNTVAKQYVDKNITRICLDKIRDRFLKGYNNTVAKMANMLEELLTSVYNLGKGNRELSENEKNDINDRWNKRCRNDLHNAYSKGTKALALVLSCACNDNKAMDILNKGK